MTLEELRDLIDQADHAYYTQGGAVMEDARYDKLKEELQRLSPDDVRLKQVGSAIRGSMLQKKIHTIPMGSQFKASNRSEYDAWFKTVTTGLWNGSQVEARKEPFHASYKMDGGSFSFEYQEGRLIAAVSRGDGFTGEDVTANAFKFNNLPTIAQLPDGTPFSGFVRGEVLLTIPDWEMADPEKQTNPRNCAVGIARRKSGEQCELLQVHAFRVFDEDGSLLGQTEEIQSKTMTALGFAVAPYFVGDLEQAWSWYERVQQLRPTLPYWIDGVVVKLNNLELQQKLGETDHRPKGQVAVKFEAESAITTLQDVTYQVGYTGAIVPVAQFTPVSLGGTTVSCATLCNRDNIQILGVKIGDQIRVIKAGDIIPRIMEVTQKGKRRKTIEEPLNCPVCQGDVGRRSNITGELGTLRYCLNPGCDAKLKGQIDRYLISLDILGIGENLI